MLRRILPYTSLLMVLAALYSGWIFYSRRQAASEVEREAQQKLADEEQRVVSRFGDELKILSFGAAKGDVSAGERVVLCYGVSNAMQVKIEPDVEPIKPALSHCLNVFPKQTTTYTLKAEDANGNSKSASLTVKVR